MNEKQRRRIQRILLDPLEKSLGPLYGKSLRYVLLDSWEAGMQNWTDDMLSEFQRRRGYDPKPYLPVLTGRVVTSAEVSDRFLWDFRRTLADMFADNHYKVATEFLHQQGIKTYGEAAGVSLEIPEDTLLNKKDLGLLTASQFATRRPGCRSDGPRSFDCSRRTTVFSPSIHRLPSP